MTATAAAGLFGGWFVQGAGDRLEDHRETCPEEGRPEDHRQRIAPRRAAPKIIGRAAPRRAGRSAPGGTGPKTIGRGSPRGGPPRRPSGDGPGGLGEDDAGAVVSSGRGSATLRARRGRDARGIAISRANGFWYGSCKDPYQNVRALGAHEMASFLFFFINFIHLWSLSLALAHARDNIKYRRRNLTSLRRLWR